jgi:hypothetical protein
MKLTSREDIEAAIDAVHEVLMDFDHFERAALRRGAEVTRNEINGKPVWETSFTFRQKLRRATVVLERHDPPSSLMFTFVAQRFEGEVLVDLVTLGPRRTRMNTTLELRPKNLAARLLLHSLKLARGRILRRYRKRIGQLVHAIEERAGAASSHVR